MAIETVQCTVDGKTISIETGRIAKQSNGSVIVRCGKAAVMVTVNSAKPREGIDFFPLTVDFLEKIYSAGRIPGGFFKRERGMTEKEVLTSRFIDRALRPLFPDGYRDETQVTCQVISADPEFEADVLGFVGASAAVSLSSIPFPAPIAAVRVLRVDGKLIVNGTHEETAAADINIIVAGSDDALVMVEGGASVVPEADLLEALRFGHEQIKIVIEMQQELVKKAGKTKREYPAPEKDEALIAKISDIAQDRIKEASQIREKKARYAAFDEIDAEVTEKFVTEYRNAPLQASTLAEFEDASSKGRKLSSNVKNILHDLRGSAMREAILSGEPRIDGRSTTDIRPIACEVSVFPGPHGTSLFTRGETQAYVTVTLGGSRDEQMIEGLVDTHYRGFYLHYNFLPFSVGEVRPLRAPNRREQGHGALAQRAVKAIMPEPEDAPFTIRLVSEITESNGSSSMASICGATLALMEAGVPIKAPCAGIAMGLITDGTRNAVLSDILGDEDHLGDMDFKVAGTTEGVTAIQMDLKIEGLDWAVLETALEQARVGRLHILKRMAEETAQELPGFKAREELSENAPRMSVLWIKPDRIRDLIGPGGKVIRGIQETTGAKVDVDDSGRCTIFAPNSTALSACQGMVEEITQEADVGKLYVGKVKRVTDFGAFVEIFPGTDGLLHISELADHRVAKVEDICVEGDEVMVKCIDVDPSGKIRLSRRAALEEELEKAKD
ncbi:MAG: polyribonucleotide nucleotidyltransferase [bacterium]|nr:polyribonucleotide nucleotidyltransferase [bacterium]